jgi:hypothetical protein
VSRRRKIALSVLGVIALLIGAATLWQNGRPENRYAHLLLLDPKTGETLRRQILDGGYAFPALLSGGRVAVATVDSCPDKLGGSVTIFDATLEHVLRHRSLAPCAVAHLDAAGLRELVGDAPEPAPAFDEKTMTFRLGDGKLTDSADEGVAPGRSNRLTAYDAAGRKLWTRSSFDGQLGAADVRGDRIAVVTTGQFTPGGDWARFPTGNDGSCGLRRTGCSDTLPGSTSEG